jgi:hypothetical protein
MYLLNRLQQAKAYCKRSSKEPTPQVIIGSTYFPAFKAGGKNPMDLKAFLAAVAALTESDLGALSSSGFGEEFIALLRRLEELLISQPLQESCKKDEPRGPEDPDGDNEDEDETEPTGLSGKVRAPPADLEGNPSQKQRTK